MVEAFSDTQNFYVRILADLAEALLSDSLAIVPLTPDDDHAQSLRRSLREPRPCYAGAQPKPPEKPPVGKGLQRGFLKQLLDNSFMDSSVNN